MGQKVAEMRFSMGFTTFVAGDSGQDRAGDWKGVKGFGSAFSSLCCLGSYVVFLHLQTV